MLMRLFENQLIEISRNSIYDSGKEIIFHQLDYFIMVFWIHNDFSGFSWLLCYGFPGFFSEIDFSFDNGSADCQVIEILFGELILKGYVLKDFLNNLRLYLF